MSVQRLAKAIQQSGHCSRRRAEDLINAGKVRVNGRVVRDVVTFVAKTDKIHIDKQLVSSPAQQAKETRLYVFHKPRGMLVSDSDPRGRPCALPLVAKQLSTQRIIAVGRLDYDSEGLLLVTNSGMPFCATI